MNTETATPQAPEAPASVEADKTAAPTEIVETTAEQTPEPTEAKDDKPKKTAEQLEAELEAARRDVKRMQRGIDRRTRALAEERMRNQLAAPQSQTQNAPASSADDTVSLTRAELERRVREEAERLAPTLREQAAEVERRQGVIDTLGKQWGTEKFNQVASDLDDALGGLADSSGHPKAAVEAVFEADDPARVIEYLADPDNADEADRLSRMGPVQAGKAIARLEDKLKAEKAKERPQPSRAAAPLEPVRGEGRTTNGAPDPSNTKAWIKWANEQERRART